MKETVKSLRAYFILAGLVSAYFNGTGLRAASSVIIQALDGVGLIVALGFLYVGIALPKLLSGSTTVINVLLAVCVALALTTGGFALLLGSATAVVVSVVSIVICYYLYANVARLAAEARAAPAPTAK